MTLDHFNEQIKRLRKAFGQHSMPEERVETLWREAQYFDATWFEQLVTNAIMNQMYAPMMPYWYEQISIERERLNSLRKAKDTQEIKQIYNHIKERSTWDWSDDERKEEFGKLKKILQEI